MAKQKKQTPDAPQTKKRTLTDYAKAAKDIKSIVRKLKKYDDVVKLRDSINNFFVDELKKREEGQRQYWQQMIEISKQKLEELDKKK